MRQVPYPWGVSRSLWPEWRRESGRRRRGGRVAEGIISSRSTGRILLSSGRIRAWWERPRVCQWGVLQLSRMRHWGRSLQLKTRQKTQPNKKKVTVQFSVRPWYKTPRLEVGGSIWIYIYYHLNLCSLVLCVCMYVWGWETHACSVHGVRVEVRVLHTWIFACQDVAPGYWIGVLGLSSKHLYPLRHLLAIEQYLELVV